MMLEASHVCKIDNVQSLHHVVGQISQGRIISVDNFFVFLRLLFFALLLLYDT